MLKRLKVNNFKTLVNFEIKFSKANLIIGGNGVGKSSIYEVLRNLREFIVGQVGVDLLFKPKTLTKWQSGKIQSFELELETSRGSYLYYVEIEHDLELRKSRRSVERLKHNSRVIFEATLDTAQLYRDDYSKGPLFPSNWNLSGVGYLDERPDNKKLTFFKNVMRDFVIVKPDPFGAAEARDEHEDLDFRSRNFVAWLRLALQEDLGGIEKLRSTLRRSIPGFSSLSLLRVGENTKALTLEFDRPAAFSVAFDEVSDGQRMQVILYAVMCFAGSKEDRIVFIDEPDNYLTSSEIQPLLTAFLEGVEDGVVDQFAVVSHHPEMLNFFGSDSIIVVDCDASMQSFVGPLLSIPEGLSVAETVSRGWHK